MPQKCAGVSLPQSHARSLYMQLDVLNGFVSHQLDSVQQVQWKSHFLFSAQLQAAELSSQQLMV